MAGCRGVAVLRCRRVAVLRCCGVAVLRCCGVAVLRCCVAVLWVLGVAVVRCYSVTVLQGLLLLHHDLHGIYYHCMALCLLITPHGLTVTSIIIVARLLMYVTDEPRRTNSSLCCLIQLSALLLQPECR